ncbi:sensor domain-containing protein [Streptomyces sp. NPDC021093]|uniref:sensor domain-containing protein n=1 Tax=Streptomyces sp. NPDC021093 TaxID=3365112 RepID=UPI0037B4F59B
MDLTQQPVTRHLRPTGRIGVILREPFRAETWLRLAYLLLALPVGLLCVPLALVGGPAGRIQRALARRLLGVQVDEPERTGPLALVHAVVSTPLNLVAAVFSGFFLFAVAINLGYPLRPDNDTSDSWGGPTMAGAWAVHAAGGVLFLLVAPWVMKGFAALQTRLVRGFLGADRSGLLRTTALPMAVAAVCGLLAVLLALPLIHQA